MDLATVARGRTARVRTVALRVTIGLTVGGVLVFTFLRLVGVTTVRVSATAPAEVRHGVERAIDS